MPHKPPQHSTAAVKSAAVHRNDQRSPKAEAYHCWYSTARWQKLRWAILVRDCFTCQTCRRMEIDTSRLHCDHVEPHNGDPERFWSGPFQTLCSHCHNSDKQSRERGGRPKQVIGADGWPVE